MSANWMVWWYSHIFADMKFMGLIVEYVITTTWNGRVIPREHWVHMNLVLNPNTLRITVDSPFYNNPRPCGPAGPTDGLWAFEVIELFLLGNGSRYLEVELGPHGHHLVMNLKGKRNITDKMLPMEYTVEIKGSRWHGTARVPAAYLPEGTRTGNVYAIYGQDEERTHLALYPLGGDAPDFHRLEDFGPLLTNYS